MASLGVYLATRTAPAAHGRAVRGCEQLLEAIGHGALAIDDTVRIEGVTTTVGRHLVAACLPPSLREVTETPWDAVRGAREIARIVRELHVEIAGRCVEALEVLGRYVAGRSGLSLALDDFLLPTAARAPLEDAHRAWAHWENEYREGLITDGERLNRQFDTWSQAGFAARSYARRHAPERDPLAACAASQREPALPEVVRSPRCVIHVPFGEGLVTHLTGTLGEGIGTHEYFVRSVEARRNALTVAERQQLALEMFADLDAAIGDVEVVALDCGTSRGVPVRAIVYAEDEVGSLAAKIAGSVLAEDARDRDGALLVPAGAVLAPVLARRIEAARIASVVLRDVRTCEAVGGVCARCFGLAPEDGLWTCVGDDVGARAAAVIAREASRLPPRRIYHIC
jgi:DNA-directed RNA polymerase subunit beta'